MENVIEVAKQYVKAFKDGNPGLIEQHFLPTASKSGYFYNYESSGWAELSVHSYSEISAWTKSYNANGIMPDTEVEASLLDIQDKTAVVKILAEWAPGVSGCDYVMLVKENDNWLIHSILWQTVV
ncbi:MAG TPA: nuclear transport factor 2 family protein [Flavihumibacter sp.]|jgi:hypothetical protein